jgi:S-methylmethionine-dependent homocysteine/selenocysteine methylase
MGSITLLDGGMGRELLRIGAPFRQPEWSALALTGGADLVFLAHDNFIRAGADVITTNSYAIVPFHIGERRFATEATELAEVSGRLARRAADRAGRPVRVAGSLPPLFGSYRPDLFDAKDAARIVDPLVHGLREYVDVWLGETLGSIAEAVAVRSALDRNGVTDRPMWISYSLDGHGAVRSGESVADAVAAAIELGAEAVLFNCSPAEVITEAVDCAVVLANGLAGVGGYANRFVTDHDTSSGANEQLSDTRDDLDPARYCRFVERWVEAGATIVGGCCGMEPAHIATIAGMLANR